MLAIQLIRPLFPVLKYMSEEVIERAGLCTAGLCTAGSCESSDTETHLLEQSGKQLDESESDRQTEAEAPPVSDMLQSMFEGLGLGQQIKLGKSKRGQCRNRKQAVPDIQAITAAVMSQMGKTQAKVWKYMILKQRKVCEERCTGEIINLYREVQQLYKGTNLMPLWTTLNGEPVLVCFNTDKKAASAAAAAGGCRSLHMYPNMYANRWFADSGLVFEGAVTLVPMNQTKYGEFKTEIKRLLLVKVSDL